MDGILPFLKPPGITSHDAVAICRRILKRKSALVIVVHLIRWLMVYYLYFLVRLRAL